MNRSTVGTALLLGAVAVLVLEVGRGGEAAPRVQRARTRPSLRVVKGRQFAFTSDRHPEHNFSAIYVATEHITGLKVRRLTDQPHPDLSPSWSPDGQHIVFRSHRHDQRGDIYTVRSDGTDVRRLTVDNDRDEHPKWSPKGDKILWMRFDESIKWNIWVMDPNGGNKVNLTPKHPYYDGYANWSPDGEHIVFVSNRDAPDGLRHIYRMEANGSGAVQLTHGPGQEGWPAWSPDGNHIAFTRDDTNHYPDIFIMKADGTELAQLTTYANYDHHPTWSPDSKTILFARGELLVNQSIYAMDADGSNVRQVTNTPHGRDECPDYLVIR